MSVIDEEFWTLIFFTSMCLLYHVDRDVHHGEWNFFSKGEVGWQLCDLKTNAWKFILTTSLVEKFSTIFHSLVDATKIPNFPLLNSHTSPRNIFHINLNQ